MYTLIASNGECEQIEEMNADVSFVKLETNDTVTCLDSFYLGVHEAGGDIFWSTNQTTPVIAIWQTGTYWVTVSNEFCLSSDTIHIEFDPELINLGNDTAACESFEIELNDEFDTYLWSVGSFDNKIRIDSSM